MRPDEETPQNNGTSSQPQSPNQNLQNGFSERTIQPLTPEREIRTYAESASNVMTPPSPEGELSTAAPAVSSTPPTPTEPQLSAPAPTIDSITPAATQLLPPILENDSQPKKRKGLIIFLALLILAGLGAGAYFFLIPRSGDTQKALDSLTKAVTEDATQVDLVTETANFSTYERPRQWINTRIGLTDGFGASEQSLGHPVASVTLTATSPDNSSKTMIAKDGYGQFRKLNSLVTVGELPETHAKAIFSTCSSKVDSKVEEDTKEAGNTVGLTLTTSTCTREDGTYTVKARTVIGNDYRFRTITIAATSSEWDKNKSAFQKMLESVTALQQ